MKRMIADYLLLFVVVGLAMAVGYARGWDAGVQWRAHQATLATPQVWNGDAQVDTLTKLDAKLRECYLRDKAGR